MSWFDSAHHNISLILHTSTSLSAPSLRLRVVQRVLRLKSYILRLRSYILRLKSSVRLIHPIRNKHIGIPRSTIIPV
jgi:hypothetical protein